jgi:hypothetical protein
VSIAVLGAMGKGGHKSNAHHRLIGKENRVYSEIFFNHGKKEILICIINLRNMFSEIRYKEKILYKPKNMKYL